MSETNNPMGFWGDILFRLCVFIPFVIPVSLGWRLLVFLKDGYNPKITIDTFFPQSSNEFSWKGVEMIYDFFANTPIEFITVFVWCGLVAFTLWWVGE